MIHDEELAIASIVAELIEAEENLTKEAEVTTEVQDTLNKIHNAYDKLKDSTFGNVFSRFVSEIEGTGELSAGQSGACKFLKSGRRLNSTKKRKKWYSFKVPHSLDYQNLVHITFARITRIFPKNFTELTKMMRRRDGFGLTDYRGTMRDALNEIDYCLICHERGKDSCSTGLHDREGNIQKNPLGIKTEGCPLDEKISEMHLLKRSRRSDRFARIGND